MLILIYTENLIGRHAFNPLDSVNTGKEEIWPIPMDANGSRVECKDFYLL